MITAAWRALESGAVVSYCVHEAPDQPADRLERAERFVFLRDGFRFSAALFAPFWLAAKGLWLALVTYVFVACAIVVGLNMLGVQPLWITLSLIALHVLVGAEAASIQRWTLEQRDWKLVGTVVGRNSRECERRFFEKWFSGQSASVSLDEVKTSPVAPLSGGQQTFSVAETGRGGQSDRLTERLRQVFGERS